MSLNAQLYILAEKLQALVQASLADWKQDNKVKRLWQRDALLWTGANGPASDAAARCALTSAKM